ncbi:MAG: hypothetical protein K9M17_01310 [Mariprofundaceae bacterium]|nr:hypothetical protein [Mariprofundaceae bacterium]
MSSAVDREGSSLTITLPFSFKGKIFRPDCRIDLDELMEKGSIPCLYTHLANENRIDIHSYEYDVMMMSDMEFSDATGMAIRFVHGDKFDVKGFESEWNEKRVDMQLQQIANRHMNQTDIEQHPRLKQALVEAYRLGTKSAGIEKEIHSTTSPGF